MVGKNWNRSGPVLLLLFFLCGSAHAGRSQVREPDVHFEPTPMDVVQAMLQKARVTKDDVVYDLGCGDGRIVIAAAQQFGARGVGVDIDPARIRESRENARQADVSSRVKFIQGDLFAVDLRKATVVALYLLNELNLQLRPKLLSELRPGARIVSHAFDMGDWEPDEIGQVRDRSFYYWVVPAHAAGTWHWSFDSSAIGGWPNELVLTQEFQELKGQAEIQGWQTRVREAALVGNRLRFRLRYNFEGQNVAMRFQGHVEGDTIRGSVEVRGGPWDGRHEWSAKRMKK